MALLLDHYCGYFNKEQMKVNIKCIQGALFWGREQYYDLEAGQCYAVEDIELEENWKELKLIRIPVFSIAPICQRYFEFLMSERELEDKYNLSAYPKFELGERDGERVLADEYIDKARNFFEEVQTVDEWRCENSIQNPGWYSGFPDYYEFQDHIARQFAKEWCEKQGYAWYEEEPLPPMLTPDKFSAT